MSVHETVTTDSIHPSLKISCSKACFPMKLSLTSIPSFSLLKTLYTFYAFSLDEITFCEFWEFSVSFFAEQHEIYAKVQQLLTGKQHAHITEEYWSKSKHFTLQHVSQDEEFFGLPISHNQATIKKVYYAVQYNYESGCCEECPFNLLPKAL